MRWWVWLLIGWGAIQLPLGILIGKMLRYAAASQPSQPEEK